VTRKPAFGWRSIRSGGVGLHCCRDIPSLNQTKKGRLMVKPLVGFGDFELWLLGETTVEGVSCNSRTLKFKLF